MLFGGSDVRRAGRGILGVRPLGRRLMKKDKLQISFDGPEHGWMTVTVSNATDSYTFVPSHVVYDSIAEVALALLAILDGAPHAIVRWNDEPVEHEWVLTRKADDLEVTV